MLHLLKLALAGGSVAIACSACSAPVEHDDEIERARFGVIGGEPSGPEDDAVVRVEAMDGFGARIPCSGVLAAANLMVTARHCVANFNKGPFDCGLDGELSPPADAGTFGTYVDPSTISVFVGAAYDVPPSARGAGIFSTDAPSVCRDDIAFVVLDRAVTAPISPLRVLEPTERGEVVRVLGFGTTGEVGEKIERRRLDGLPVLEVGPDQVATSSDALAPPRSLALGPSACPGDSGGPALSERSGAVVGVASLTVGDCEAETVRNFFAQVRPHATLAAAAFEAAGAEIWIEGAARPGTVDACAECSAEACRFARGELTVGSARWLLAAGLLAARRRRRGISRS